FFLEMLVANFLPARAGIRVFTITDPMRRFLLEGIDPSRRLAHMLWPAERDFDISQVGAPLLNLALLSAVTRLLGSWLYTRNEYASRAREGPGKRHDARPAGCRCGPVPGRQPGRPGSGGEARRSTRRRRGDAALGRRGAASGRGPARLQVQGAGAEGGLQQ